jgi:hypothetical protein
MALQTEAIMLLALHGGMRQGEIFRATLDDLSPDNAYVVVRGAAKGAGGLEIRMREAPMTQEMRRALHEWLAFRRRLKPPHDQPWLVLDPHASPNMVLAPSSPFNPMSSDRMGEILGKLGVSLQRLRHTAATNYLRAGMELERVSRLLHEARSRRHPRQRPARREQVHQRDRKTTGGSGMSYKPEKYPEHAKLKAISDESNAIGAFLDFGLGGQQLVLAERSRTTPSKFVPTGRSIQDILARYFGIDQEALKHEKRQMLAEMTALSA